MKGKKLIQMSKKGIAGNNKILQAVHRFLMNATEEPTSADIVKVIDPIIDRIPESELDAVNEVSEIFEKTYGAPVVFVEKFQGFNNPDGFSVGAKLIDFNKFPKVSQEFMKKMAPPSMFEQGE